jgi:hypothetical protein
MATVQQIADHALKLIMVLGADASMQPEDSTDFIFLLNNYLSALEADGLNLGYTVVVNLSDEVTVPPGAVLGIIYNMAVLSCPSYGGTASPEVIAGAEKGLKTIRRLCVVPIAAVNPSTLPRGNGNYSWNNTDFYPGTE